MMKKVLIIINEIGDEIKYFSSIILKNDVDILYICNSKDKNDFTFNDWYSINDYIKIDIDVEDNHYDFNKLNNFLFSMKNNNYDEIYTYDLSFNNDLLKDDILYCCQQYFKNINSCTKNSYPDLVIELTKSEFWLKKNYLLTFINDNLSDINAVELFKKNTNIEIRSYYQKKYLLCDDEFLKSPYYIEIQYLLITILKKYNFKTISMVGFDNYFFSNRVDFNDLNFIYKYDENSDVIVLNKNDNRNLFFKYCITFNFELENALLLEKHFVNSSVERMYINDTKSNVELLREKMVVYVYENINNKL